MGKFVANETFLLLIRLCAVFLVVVEILLSDMPPDIDIQLWLAEADKVCPVAAKEIISV